MLKCPARARQSFFPTTDTSPDDLPAEGSGAGSFACPACCSHLRCDDSRHTRVPGQCRAAGTIAREWICPGCIAGKRRLDSAHTLDPDQCKWALSPSRARRTETERPPLREIRDEPTREAVGPDVGQLEQDEAGGPGTSRDGAVVASPGGDAGRPGLSTDGAVAASSSTSSHGPDGGPVVLPPEPDAGQRPRPRSQMQSEAATQPPGNQPGNDFPAGKWRARIFASPRCNRLEPKA